MVTPGHMACGAVTAMRSLSSALQLRHHQEGAARHRPVGRGCRDGHARRHLGGRERGHAALDQASACPHGPAGAGCGRGGRRVRPGGTGGVRHHADRGIGKVPAVHGPAGSPEGRRPPAARGRVPRARQVTWARKVSGTGPREGPGPGGRSARGRRSRRARWRSACCPIARAEPHERVLTGRPDRRAQGRARAGRPGHPGNPADHRIRAHRGRAGCWSVGGGSAARRAGPRPAAA